MKQGTLLDSSRYKHFIHDRDQALEKILQNTEVDISRHLFEALDQVRGTIADLLLNHKAEFLTQIKIFKILEDKTLFIFSGVLYPIVHRIQRMRRAIYALTYLSELEAIGQSTQKNPTQIDRFKFKEKLNSLSSKKTILNENLDDRVWFYLMNLRSDILYSFRLGVSKKLSTQELFIFVKSSFPKVNPVKRAKKILKTVRESNPKEDRLKKDFIDTDFIDQGQWDFTLDQYKKTELPPSRFDQESQLDSESSLPKYSWELEQELTDDFVNQVRNGQIEAANQMGIQEFVWVSVIDQKTCETCCLPRNGLTTAEIKNKVESGDFEEDDCGALTPPAHPNCRCQLAPVASTNELEGPDWKSFEEWLES